MSSQLSQADFNRLRELLEHSFGLKMPPQKKLLLESRLSKRLHALRQPSMEAYCDFLFSDAGMESELVHMVDVVTTNKTEFFREANAFEFLAEHGLPALLATRPDASPSLHFWSAACSTGEEAYTLAMVLEDFRSRNRERPFGYVVLATDISSRALDVARRGIYDRSKIEPISLAWRRRYLLRGRQQQEGLVRVVPALRSRVRFERLNLVQPMDIRPQLDVIFCRNVIIYFNRETQIRMLGRMCELLVPGGFMMMGHSETLNGMELPLEPVGPMIYRRLP